MYKRAYAWFFNSVPTQLLHFVTLSRFVMLCGVLLSIYLSLTLWDLYFQTEGTSHEQVVTNNDG